MTDYTSLDAEAQKLIDAAVAAQKSSDDAIIAGLRTQLANCQAGTGSGGGGQSNPTITATVTNGTNQATLAWTSSTITGLTGWQVARDGNDSNGGGPWSTQVAASTTSYTFLSLVGGTTYNLSVAPIINGTVGTAVTKQAAPTASSTGGGTTTPPAATPASISDTGFTYTGSWGTVASPSEHWASAGASATVQFTAATGGSTFSLRGYRGPSNGTVSVKIDNGTAVSVNESGTATSNVTLYTSGLLAAGTHTVTVTVTSGDGSIQGADISNGTFTAPASTGGSGGGTTTPTTNPSGVAMPGASAYSGYTQTLAQDFNTDAALGSFGTVYPGYNGYDGGTSGDSGTVWSSAKTLSVANGVLRMHQFKDNTGIYTPAVTPVVAGSAWTGQQYGKWIVRFKADRPSQYWKTAWLLWPATDNWNDGEIDYPEQFFDSAVRVNVHENTGNPVANVGASSSVTFGDNAWHTAMIEIDPGVMKFSLDGTVIYTTTAAKYIPKVPFRWALQNEMDPGTIPVGAEANVDIDWLAVYKRN